MKYTSRKIVLQDYAVMASIGIHDHERAQRQRLLITIEIQLSYDVSDEDDIGAVLDYDFLRREIRRKIDERHFNLQETLCHEIIELIGAQKGVSRVLVSTRKPDVYEDCASIGYTAEAEF